MAVWLLFPSLALLTRSLRPPALLAAPTRPTFPTLAHRVPRIPCARGGSVDAREGREGGKKMPLRLDSTSKLQLAILAGSNFLVQMAIGMIMAVTPLFAQSIGLGAAGVALLVALPQLPKLLLNLPVGHLVDVVGRRPPLIVGAILDGIGQLLTAAATSLAQIVPARLVVGVGTAVGSVTGPATLAYTMDVCGKFPEHSGLLLGALQATGFLALAVGPAIGGALADRSGPALPFVLFGVLQLLSAAVKCLLPETLPRAKRRDASLKGLRQVMDGLWASYRRLLVDRKQTGLLAVKCSFLAGLSLVLTIVPLHAAAAWSASAADVGALASFAMLLCLVFSPIAGVLADRVGSKALIIGGSLVSAASVACMPCAKSKTSYYLVRALWAAGEAYLITAYSTLALNVTPEDQRGARNSLDHQVGDIALLFLVVLVGVIGGKSLNMAFWATSGFMLLCNVFFVSSLQAA